MTYVPQSAAMHMKNKLVADAAYTFGGPDDWAVYIGKLPDTPNRCICIYDSGGLEPNPKWLLDYPSVQFRIRGNSNDYDVAWAKAKELRDLLLGIPSYDAPNGDRIVMVNSIGDVAFTGWDQQNARPAFVFNFRLIIEPSPEGATNREPL